MIAPLYNHVAIRRLDEVKTPGGIVIPEAVRQGAAAGPVRGTVVACGAGRITNVGTLAPLSVKAGDEVLFNASGASVYEDAEEGRLLIVQEGAIIGVLSAGPS